MACGPASATPPDEAKKPRCQSKSEAMGVVVAEPNVKYDNFSDISFSFQLGISLQKNLHI